MKDSTSEFDVPFPKAVLKLSHLLVIFQLFSQASLKLSHLLMILEGPAKYFLRLTVLLLILASLQTLSSENAWPLFLGGEFAFCGLQRCSTSISAMLSCEKCHEFQYAYQASTYYPFSSRFADPCMNLMKCKFLCFTKFKEQSLNAR